jgi:hypothetical protein
MSVSLPRERAPAPAEADVAATADGSAGTLRRAPGGVKRSGASGAFFAAGREQQRRAVLKNPSLRGPIRMRISDDGLEIESSTARSEMKWNTVRAYLSRRFAKG